MKKQLVARIRFYGKSLFFITASFILLSVSAKAHSLAQDPALGDGAVVSHLESGRSESLFHVRVPNEAGEKFRMTIKDASGTVLFSQVYDDKKFDKKFLITDVDPGAKLRFTIISLKDKTRQTFEVNTVTHVVEDVVVTRL